MEADRQRMESTDYLLARQLQVGEQQRLAESLQQARAKGPVDEQAARVVRYVSNRQESSFKVRPVLGDGDCFFHAVGRSELDRTKLVQVLITNHKDLEVREGFMAEIRQFLTVGLDKRHSGAEQTACEKIFTADSGRFRGLYNYLTRSEKSLAEHIGAARRALGEAITAGKEPRVLLELLQEHQPELLEGYKKALNAVEVLDQRIKDYCVQESVFKRYVEFYLRDARGYIPFARVGAGERITTPIDVISRLFKLNIQVLLEEGGGLTRVTQEREGAPISILHNGVNHFSGLDEASEASSSEKERGMSKRFMDRPERLFAADPAYFSGLKARKGPPGIGDVVEDSANSYKRSHLLRVGFSGTIYQLLVLLDKVTGLLLNKELFEATFEEEGYGNLDDIIIRTKNAAGKILKVSAFQVKHYKEPIEAKLFLNSLRVKKDGQPKKGASTKKNAKMHIGKFLEGWLALKTEHPSVQDLESVIYSNASLEKALEDCLDGGRFSKTFISHKKIELLVGAGKKKGDFYLAMYTQAKSYLDEKRSSYEAQLAKIEANLAKNLDDNKRSLEQKKLSLCEKRLSLYKKNLDLYDETLFQQFLRSFRFCVGQPDIKILTRRIVETLRRLGWEQSEADLLFICLLHEIQEWFIVHNEEEDPLKLTNAALENLLQQSRIRFQDAIELQGITSATLANIQTDCGGRTLQRQELSDLKRAFDRAGLVLVEGEKGIGKSGLVKLALLGIGPGEYLFLSARHLLQDDELKKKCLGVLGLEGGPSLIVLDSAEVLLSLGHEGVQKFLGSFLRTECTVVLTLTPEAGRRILPSAKYTSVVVERLQKDELLQNFSQLKRYQSIEPLMNLACLPFHLSIILKLMGQVGVEAFSCVLGSINVGLEAELVSRVVKGPHEEQAKVRMQAWKTLALNLASGIAPKPPRTRALIDDQIMLGDGVNTAFSHDLFFEHGLMAFWWQKWKSCETECTTLAFWEKLPDSLKFEGSISVLTKWFVLYREQLQFDLLLHIGALSEKPVLESLIAMAILLGDKELWQVFPKFSEHLGIQSNVLLAITMNSPEALKAIFKLADSAQESEGAELDHEERAQSSNSASEDTDESSYDSETNSLGQSDDSEGYSMKSGSNSSSSDDEPYDQADKSEEEQPLEAFQWQVANKAVTKYWFAGFHEEPYYEYDEGEYIENPAYSTPPRNDSLPVHQAVMVGSVNCLEILLDHDMELANARNNCDETPLHLSVLRESVPAVEALLKKNGSLFAEDEWGENPLHNAAYVGNCDIASLLLADGASPSALNRQGLTPLHIAFARLDLDLVKLFLSYEGDLAIKPFSFEEITVADLLDHQFEPEMQARMEEFVIGLIEHLNFGYNTGGEINEGTRDIVEDLMTLIEHRAQLSEYVPNFDYYDLDTEFQYMLETDQARLDNDYMENYVLDCPDRICEVLKSAAFEPTRGELVNGWLQQSSEKQYQNLKIYAEENDDQETLAQIAEYEGDEEED